MVTRKKSIRIVDIAQDAGVAASLVCSLFNGKYYGKSKGAVVGIGEETKKRIWKSCRKLGYQPKDPALEMEIYPEQADVTFILPVEGGGFNNPFFSLILDGLGHETAAKGVNLNLGRVSVGVDYLAEPDQLPLAVRRNPAGKFVMAGVPNYSLLLYLVRNGARVVYISRHIDMEGIVSLVPDYADAAKIAVLRLMEMGHRRIEVCALDYFRNNSYSVKELVRGVSAAFETVGQVFGFDDVHYTGASPVETEAMVRAMWNRPDRPSALFCFDDLTAAIVMKYLSAMEVRIPDEISLVGVNDDKICESLEPGLTTVHLPMYEIGRKAFEWVTRCAVEGVPDGSPREVWPVSLVERQSAKPLE